MHRDLLIGIAIATIKVVCRACALKAGARVFKAICVCNVGMGYRPKYCIVRLELVYRGWK